LNSVSFKRIVSADPHVMHCLRNEYPAFGGHFQVVHHTGLIDELIRTGKIHPHALETEDTLSYHDPCYLARYNGETEAPRRVLESLGVQIKEMARNGLNAR